MTRATQVYPYQPECTLSIFDIRIPGATEQVDHDRALAGECGDVEMLDLDHPILIVKPGATVELSQ